MRCCLLHVFTDLAGKNEALFVSSGIALGADDSAIFSVCRFPLAFDVQPFLIFFFFIQQDELMLQRFLPNPYLSFYVQSKMEQEAWQEFARINFGTFFQNSWQQP